jgi:hypothetical protein
MIVHLIKCFSNFPFETKLINKAISNAVILYCSIVEQSEFLLTFPFIPTFLFNVIKTIPTIIPIIDKIIRTLVTIRSFSV